MIDQIITAVLIFIGLKVVAPKATKKLDGTIESGMTAMEKSWSNE